MIQWDFKKYPDWSEGVLQLAVADYVQWWRCYVVPNLCLFHEMDVAVLTRAGCLWEFEIKVSQSDWERDRLKDTREDEPWRTGRRFDYVERFYYVVAPKLTAPDWLPEWAGILRGYTSSYGGEHTYLGLKPERPAKRRNAQKPTPKHCEAIYTAAHRRFWSRIGGLHAPEKLAAIEGAI